MEVLDATSLAERLKWEGKEYWLHLESETPLEKYPAKQHARRVQEKLGAEQGLIYLMGQQGKNFEDSDMPAPFRQRRYFYYMSGCDEPNCHLTYDIQHDTLSLFVPRINESRIIYDGRGPTLAEALVRYDVDEVFYSDELSGFVQDWFNHSHNQGALYSLHESQSPEHQSGSRIQHALDTTSLRPAMNRTRMIKDDHEISLVRKANSISSAAHRQVLANILDFTNEAQVEGLFLDVCVSRQAKQQAYDPIAASGPNAGTLHYNANNEDFEDRQLMCLDAGCEYNMYASDITRTFPLSSSWPTKEAEDIYKLVERMQESCIKRLAPGVRYLDIHILAHQVAIDGLLALGILHNGTKEEIYKSGTSRAFFPHGLGHHVGLDVHDVGQAELMSVRRGKTVFEQTPSLYPENFHLPVYDYQTCHAPTDPQSSHLEEGMIVTVEPGLYFSAYALKHVYLPSPIHSKYINVEVLQRYFPVGGVRIEDDILITSTGYENLTTAPKGEAMLEIIRSRGRADRIRTSPIRSTEKRNSQEQPALMRAPGISTESPKSILRPIARASTMPTDMDKQKTVDFEPFEGPSLFSNFKRSMTTDERIQYWQRNRGREIVSQNQALILEQITSICGDYTKGVKHVYMTSGSDRASHCSPFEDIYPACKKCTILCETLDRLRQNLTLSEKGSPKLGAQSVFECTTKKEGIINRYNNTQSAMRQAKELLKEQANNVRKERVSQHGQGYGTDQLSDQISGSIQQPSKHHGPRQIQNLSSMQQHDTRNTASPELFSINLAHRPHPSIATPNMALQSNKVPTANSRQYHQSQVDKTGAPLHNAQRLFDLPSHQIPNANTETHAIHELIDLKPEHCDSSIHKARRIANIQKAHLPTPTSLENLSRTRTSSRTEKLEQLQSQIRLLEAKLKIYGQSDLQPKHQTLQQSRPSQTEKQFALEIAKLEEKLRRLRAKRQVLISAIQLQHIQPMDRIF